MIYSNSEKPRLPLFAYLSKISSVVIPSLASFDFKGRIRSTECI